MFHTVQVTHPLDLLSLHRNQSAGDQESLRRRDFKVMLESPQTGHVNDVTFLHIAPLNLK